MGRTPMLVALGLLVPAAARAQSGFDAHGFYVSALDGDPRELVTIQRPKHMLLGDWYVGGLVEVLQDAERIGGLSEIDGQVALNAAAGVVVNDRARLDVAAPIFFATTGEDTPQDAALGDVRVSSQIVILQPRVVPQGGGFGLGAVPWVTLPSGPEEEGLGQEEVTGGLLANATYEWTDWTLTGQAGLGFQPEDELAGRDHVEAGVGLVYQLLQRTSLGVEGRGYARLVDDWDQAGVPFEVLLSIRQVSRRGPHMLAGAAFAVTEGIGVPEWRLFIGGGYGRRQDPDPDKDLLVGADDACPDEAEDYNGYEDDDGCPDVLTTLAVVPQWPDRTAMLEASVVVSNEEDTFTAARGPAVFSGLIPGQTWAAAARYACWAGEVEDLVLEPGEQVIGVPMARGLTADLRFVVVDERNVPIEDVVVRWIDDGPDCSPVDELPLPVGLGDVRVGAGEHTILVGAPGFASRTFRLDVPEGHDGTVDIVLSAPQVAVVDRDDREDDLAAITSPERVHFEFDRAEILPYSYPLLDRVAQIVIERPELGLIEIAGHADERGTDRYNDALSLRRALAVRAWLVAAGVPEGRLYVRGYGERVPLAEGRNETAWALNRRVEISLGFAEVPRIERRPET